MARRRARQRARIVSLVLQLICFAAWGDSSPGEALPLGELIAPDGTLDLDSGFSGSLDPTGWRLVVGEDGAPRFVADDADAPTAEPASPDDNWDGRFAVPNVTPEGEVYDILVDGPEVYVGGLFLEAGDVEVNYIARWDGARWQALGTGMDGSVYALALHDGDLYAGGGFTTAGGVTANRIARWDGSRWHDLDGGVSEQVYEYDPRVTALAAIGSDLYVGGSFRKAGTVPARNIARWDGTSWHEVGGGVDGSPYGRPPFVAGLVAKGTDLYVSGQFFTAGGTHINHIARWDGSGWHALGPGFDFGGRGGPLVLAGGDVYAAYWFRDALGGSAWGVQRWDGTRWNVLGSGTNGSVAALAASDGGLLVGGGFSRAGEVGARNLARWDGSAWKVWAPSAEPAAGLDAMVWDVVARGSDVFAGGWFQAAGEKAASLVARWDGRGWHALGSGISGEVEFHPDPHVIALAVAGDDLYVGGDFTTAGGLTVNGVARWDGDAWHALGAGVSGGVRYQAPVVLALAVSGSDVYVGGRFTQAGDVPVSHVARWDGTAWYALGEGVSGVADPFYGPAVAELAVSGGDLYVGGDFTQAGGVEASGIARWDGAGWHALGSGVDGSVGALLVDGGDLYVGGSFSTAGGVAANRIARWDGTDWHALGSGVESSDFSYVRSLAAVGTDLYASGEFRTAGGVPASNVARWDGSRWYPLGSGVPWVPYELAASGADLYVGGAFLLAGGKPSRSFARWSEARDLSVTGTDVAGPIALGETFDQTITVTNRDAGLAATGVTLTTNLPPGFALLVAVPDQGSCWIESPVVCELGTLGPEASADVVLYLRAVSNGAWFHDARVDADQADPAPDNDRIESGGWVEGPAAAGVEDWDDGDAGGFESGPASTLRVEPSGGNPDGSLCVDSDAPGGASSALAMRGHWVGDYGRWGLVRLSLDLAAPSGDALTPEIRFLPSPDPYAGSWSYRLAGSVPDDGAWHAFEIVFNPDWSDAQALAAGWQSSAARSFRETLAGVAVLEIANGAGGGTLCIDNLTTGRSGAVRFEASLEIEAAGLEPARARGVGVALVNGGAGGRALGSLSLPGDWLGLSAPLETASGETQALLALANGPASLTGGSAERGLGGPMPLHGTLHLCLLTGCQATLPVPATSEGTRGIGLGGGPIVASDPVSGVTVTLQGAPWSLGPVTIRTTNGTAYRTGFAHGPLSETSSTATVSGVLQLVTPISITSSTGTRLPAFGVLTLHVIPEPGRALLFVAAAGLLVLLGRKRSARH